MIGIGVGAVAVASAFFVRRRAIASSHPPYGRVEVDENGVLYRREDGSTESVRWDELNRIRILTTSEGPYLPDTFWVLETETDLAGSEESDPEARGEDSSATALKIPSEAKGVPSLADRAMGLPSFRTEAFVEAMASTEYASFTVWDR